MWRGAFSGWNRGPYCHLRQHGWGHKADICHSIYMGPALYRKTLHQFAWSPLAENRSLFVSDMSSPERGQQQYPSVNEEGLAGYLSTAPVVTYRLINGHPAGSAEENWIEVGQATCVQMFLSFWGTDFVILPIFFQCFLHIFIKRPYIWIWTGVVRSIWWNSNKTSLICDSP